MSVPPIPDGEATAYRIVEDGKPTGIMVVITSRDEFRDERALRIDLLARSETDSGVTTDSSVLYVTRDSMAPITTFRFVRVNGRLAFTSAANYLPDSVAVTAYTQDQQSQKMLPANRRTYDIDELTSLGRAIQFTPGRTGAIRIINPAGPPFGGALIDVKVSPGGEEPIDVPAGTFDCYKLVVNLGPQQVNLWYEKAASRRMVRYEAPGSRLVMELLPRPRTVQPEDQP
jgi:hypothetical protein